MFSVHVQLGRGALGLFPTACILAWLLQTSAVHSISSTLPSGTQVGGSSFHFFFPQLHTALGQKAKNGKFFFAASSAELGKK